MLVGGIKLSGNFYIDFLYFLIYAFIGWLCEVAYCSILERRFINRGFLNSPICPIYGFGALSVIILLTPIKQNYILLFILGVIITSILEYFTGWAMEKLFHTRWWDYSKHKININGRVCLENSIMFGLLVVIIMTFVHPHVQSFVGRISYVGVQVIAIISIMILTSDFTITVNSIVALNEKLAKIKEMSSEVKDMLDRKHMYMEERFQDRLCMAKENIEHHTEEFEKLIDEIKNLSENNKFFQRRLINAYPKMQSIKNKIQLLDMKKSIKEKRYKKKKK